MNRTTLLWCVEGLARGVLGMVEKRNQLDTFWTLLRIKPPHAVVALVSCLAVVIKVQGDVGRSHAHTMDLEIQALRVLGVEVSETSLLLRLLSLYVPW